MNPSAIHTTGFPAMRLGKAELRMLLPFMRPYFATALAAVFGILVTTALKLAGPLLMQRAIDQGIRRGDASALNKFGALFLIAATASFLALRFAAVAMGTVGQKTLRDLRIASFEHLNKLSLGFFERERSGRLVARMTSDIEALERLVTDDLIRMVTEVMFLAGAAVLLFLLDARLAAVSLVVAPAIIAGTLIFRRKGRSAYQDVRERVAGVLTYLHETLRGVHVVQAFGAEQGHMDEFGRVNDRWAEAKVRTYRLESQYFSSVDFLVGLSTAAVLVFGGNLFLNGGVSFGKLTAFTVYLGLFFDPINHLSERFTQFQSANAGLARVAHLFAVKPEVADSIRGPSHSSLRGAISLEAVSFGYGGSQLALNNIDLFISPGETLALVGPTGAGKSTIVKLIARFYDVGSGRITLDGIDIREVALSNLRSQMALVPQESFLFAGTVLENIRFGRPSATKLEVEAVCQKLGIDQVIESLPSGYETQVRERGSRLAAGERQLLALARAHIADPKILLLDEATSQLDSATESRVDQALRRTLENRTCVIIAHRLPTVMHADKIAVIDHGRVIESGVHDELIVSNGRYSSLYGSWLESSQTS